MIRIRLKPRDGRKIFYRNTDLIKDAAINMMLAAGAPASLLSGMEARHWSAGAVFAGKVGQDKMQRRATEVIVSTIDPDIAGFLMRSKAEDFRKVQPATSESIDLSGASITADLDPVIPGMTNFLECLCLTPICISRKGESAKRKWHDSVLDVDIGAAVNARLSRIAGRTVALGLTPDDEYIESHDRHSVLVSYKETPGPGGLCPALVSALSFPFLLYGSSDDLKLAWYAGLGERNRQGFGIIGTI
jgi:CRISPR-associated endoribonuclease Cas6